MVKVADKKKITSNYYEKYVGSFAKRFYTPFEEEHIYPILGFKMKEGFAFFDMGEWEWDVEDCVIITNETPMIEDNRIANINHPEYKGYNPYTQNSR